MKPQPEYATEGLLQIACVRWHSAHYRRTSILFAVPNGGTRDIREAKALKDQGVVAGAPDLILAAPGGKTYYIELKNGYQELRDVQKLFKAKANYLGHEYYEAYTLAGFQALVCRLLGATPEPVPLSFT